MGIAHKHQNPKKKHKVTHMTKGLSISISDHVYDTYLSAIQGNRSQYIEKLIVIGAEAEIGSDTSIKSRMLKLIAEARNQEEEIKKLRAEIGRLKKHLGTDPDLQRKNDIATGIRKAGMLRGYVGNE